MEDIHSQVTDMVPLVKQEERPQDSTVVLEQTVTVLYPDFSAKVKEGKTVTVMASTGTIDSWEVRTEALQIVAPTTVMAEPMVE